MRLLCFVLLLAVAPLRQGQAPREQEAAECTQAKIDLVHAWAEELAEQDVGKLSWSELQHRARTALACSLMVTRARAQQRPDIKTTDQESPRILAWELDAAMVDEAVSGEESRRYQDFLVRHNLLRQFLAEDAAGKK